MYVYFYTTEMPLCFFHYGFVVFNLSSPAVVHNRYYLDVVPNVVTSHLLHTLILETGLVCNTAEQIESASQLKRHTYLIQPVIQGYALLPLHNTLSMFVAPTPKVELKYCHFTYWKPGQGQLHLQYHYRFSGALMLLSEVLSGVPTLKFTLLI